MHIRRALVASSFLLSTVAASCLHDPTLFRRQSSGTAVAISDFSYNATHGPFTWAALNPNYTACGLGSDQSPINLDGKIQTAQELPVMNFPDVASATMNNIGTHVEVMMNATATFAGRKYNLFQFHFHTPSEHRINGEYYPMEMHIVWIDTTIQPPTVDAFLANAVMFEMSDNSSTTLLNGITQTVQQIAQPGTTTKTGRLEFQQVVNQIQTKPAFDYKGSITTPPCTEGLRILLTKEPLPISARQYVALKNVMKFNSRFMQNDIGQENILLAARDQLAHVQGGQKKKSAAVASFEWTPVFVKVGATLGLLLLLP